MGPVLVFVCVCVCFVSAHVWVGGFVWGLRPHMCVNVCVCVCAPGRAGYGVHEQHSRHLFEQAQEPEKLRIVRSLREDLLKENAVCVVL